ncbi:MAG TPA: Uma2 family endonuclease [Thermoanaerobaculia bacterium]|nr:Uma2 family endonuclease [Thermoanaerobaculia bacterium]
MSMNARGFATPRLFTVAEYYRMADAGILKPDDRVELIEGEIVEMSPSGSPHAGYVGKLNHLLNEVLRGKPFLVRVQSPVRLSQFSEPEPDIAVVNRRDDFYTGGHPTAADVVVVIEVADSRLAYDRSIKIPLYLRSGIAEAWLVDVTNHAIEVHSEDGVHRFAARETAVSAVLPEIKIPVI